MTLVELKKMHSVEQKSLQTAKELDQSKQRYERMANTVPVMLYDSMLSPSGTSIFLYVAPQPCREILELDPEALLADMSLVWNLIHPDDLDRFQEEDLAANREGKSFTSEVRIITPSGRLKWLLVSSKPNPVEPGEAVVWSGFLKDITARKEAEMTSRSLSAQLEATNREIQQMIYVTSHDLSASLVSIEGFSRMLENSLDDVLSVLANETLSPETNNKLSLAINRSQESRRYIKANVGKAGALIKGLSQVSRLGRVALEMEKIDMNRLMAEVLLEFEFQRIVLGVEILVEELPGCYGDSGQVNQLFANLLGNALKYVSPDRPGRIIISGRKAAGHSIYCIEDNGVGIALEHQQLIFEMFHQLNQSVEGDGLGLSIVQKIVERHDGKVRVESELGKGSKFYVSLSAV